MARLPVALPLVAALELYRLPPPVAPQPYLAPARGQMFETNIPAREIGTLRSGGLSPSSSQLAWGWSAAPVAPQTLPRGGGRDDGSPLALCVLAICVAAAFKDRLVGALLPPRVAALSVSTSLDLDSRSDGSVGDEEEDEPCIVSPEHPWDDYWDSSQCLQDMLARTDYWEDPRIHTMGNSGILGSLHAGMAPLFTGMIDVLAHGMRQPGGVRAATAERLAALPSPGVYGMRGGGAIVDLCCGIGASTRVLEEAFPAARVFGVDASNAMLRVARNYERLGRRLLAKGKAKIEYTTGNAERTGLPAASFDITTCFYGFHEVPYEGRLQILNEMERLLLPGGWAAILDISPTFEPSHSMLAGEPYILEYQANITEQLHRVEGLTTFETVELVPGQVTLWILKKQPVCS